MPSLNSAEAEAAALNIPYLPPVPEGADPSAVYLEYLVSELHRQGKILDTLAPLVPFAERAAALLDSPAGDFMTRRAVRKASKGNT